MSLRTIVSALVILVALSVSAYAQEQSQPASPERMRPQRERAREDGRHGRMGGPERMGLMRELNLTEEQRQQQRAIMQRHLASTKAQREELFKLREKRIAGAFTEEDGARAQTLRREIHESMQGIRGEMENVLTAEQRARVEQLKTEHKAHRLERRERRRERRDDREAIPQ